MKKTSLLIAIALLALPTLSFATAVGSAFVSGAAATISGTKTGGNDQPMGQLSSNVKIAVLWSTTTFSASTKHLNGTKEFGSSSGSTKLFTKDLAAGTDVPTTPTASTEAFYSAWTAL